MNDVNNNKDSVELVLLLNSTYISTARVTASSVAEKMNFSISKVEDIKTAVSEVVTLLIDNFDIKNTTNNNVDPKFKIKFFKVDNNLQVEVNSSTKCLNNNTETSLSLIKNCMDDVSFNYDNNSFLSINMTKKFN